MRHAVLLLLAATAPLMGALASQYLWHYAPCTLCLWQRVPYAIIVALALILAFLPRHAAPILVLSVLLMLADAGLALFHTGVEAGWWKFESACTAGLDTQSLSALKESLHAAPLVSCDQAMLYVLGLSMAAWNVLYALAAAAFFAYVFWHERTHTSR